MAATPPRPALSPFPLALLALLGACGDPEKDTGAGSDTDTGDTNVVVDPGIDGCGAALAPTMSLAVNVDWTSNVAGRSWVEFGPDTTYGHVTPSTEGNTTHHFSLIGNPAEQPVYWRAVTEVDGEPLTCTGTTTTGPLPKGFPQVEITVPNAEAWDGAEYLMGAFFDLSGAPPRLAAVTRDGTVVWYYQGPEGHMFLEVLHAHGGRGLLLNQFNSDFSSDDSLIRRIDWDGTTLEETQTPLAHHFFTELPDGTLAYNQLDPRSWYDPTIADYVDVIGDDIAEIQPGSDEVTKGLSTWDLFTPEREPDWDNPNIYGYGVDWTHANALKYDPETDTYLWSLGFMSTVVESSRSTGLPTRIFGRFGGDFSGDSTIFALQHDPTLQPDGNLTVFTTSVATRTSGGVEYTIDETTQQLDEVWNYGLGDDGDIRSLQLGQVKRLENGSTFINYGGGAAMRQVSADGLIEWELHPPPGLAFANWHLLRDLYTGE